MQEAEPDRFGKHWNRGENKGRLSMPSRNAVLRTFGPKMSEIKPLLRPVLFPRGHHLTEPGEPISQMYFPVRGIVSSRVIFETDHEMELVATGFNNAVGILAALGFPKSLTRDVCVTEGHGWTIQTADFQDAVRRSPSVERAVKTFCYAQMTYAVRTATCNAMHTTEQRLARWLLIAVELMGSRDLRLSQEELAAILGVGRNHLNPLLQRLRSRGVLTVGRGRIDVLDPNALRALTCECNELLHHAMHAELDPPEGVMKVWAK